MRPEDFIITRKRKKYKFACFAEMDNCYEAEEFTPEARSSFAKDSHLVVELGAGTGAFLVEQARLEKDKVFIAVDVKADRLYTGAKLAREQSVTNILFVRAHAMQLPDIFESKSIAELWLTFSDPFPKKRHAKHRMTHPVFLQIYCNLLASTGILHFKTDNRSLFEWSLERFVEKKLILRQLSFDLHESQLPEAYKVMTTYEQRYVAEGLPIFFVDVLFNEPETASDEPIHR